MSTTASYAIDPFDTLFFRDNRPFDQSDAGLAEARGMFPPLPSVVALAVRAAMARALGWSGKGDWSKDPSKGPAMIAALGSGLNDLGSLQFGPPALLRAQGTGDEVLWPMPLHVFAEQNPLSRIELAKPHPLPPGMTFDIDGASHLVYPPSGNRDAGPLEGWFVTRAGFEEILEGRPPPASCCVSPRDLFNTERRMGIGRSIATRTAIAAQLYASSHARPELKPHTRLAITVSGGCALGSRSIPLGGAGRAATIEPLKTPIGRPVLQRAPSNPVAVILLSPAYLPAPWTSRGLQGRVPGHVLAVTSGRPLWVGPWDFLSESRAALQPLMPAGSVIFVDQAEAGPIASLEALGEHTKLGFGAVAIGAVPTS